MPMTLTGTGTVTGLTAGGLPASTITSSNIVDGTIVAADAAAGVALTGNQTGSAPLYGCRAWCVFNGTTTGTNAPTAGGNVSTVTRNSAGNYTITFTTAMPDANYAVSTGGGQFTSVGPALLNTIPFLTGTSYSAPTTTSFVVTVATPVTNTPTDPTIPVMLVVYR